MAYKKYTDEEKKQKQNEYEVKIANLFIEGIESNNAPWMKPWKPVEYVMDYNPITKKANKNAKPYSGMNQMILYLTRTIKFNSNDPRWMTFNQVREMNKNRTEEMGLFRVKKGSTGTAIKFFTLRYFDKNNNIINVDENGNYDRSKVVKTQKVLKYSYVFHASQIIKERTDKNGKSIIEPAFEPFQPEKKEPTIQFEKDKLTDELLLKNHITVTHDQNTSCFYSNETDSIHMVPMENFKSKQDYYDTLLHEVTHWTGNEKRLNRECLKKYHESIEYRAKEELIAEIGGYMLCVHNNLAFNPTQNNLAYVQSWSKALKNNPEEIFTACSEASRAVNFLMDKEKENKKTEEYNDNNIQLTVIKKGGRK